MKRWSGRVECRVECRCVQECRVKWSREVGIRQEHLGAHEGSHAAVSPHQVAAHVLERSVVHQDEVLGEGVRHQLVAQARPAAAAAAAASSIQAAQACRGGSCCELVVVVLLLVVVVVRRLGEVVRQPEGGV